MPNQVYRLDPVTRRVRVIATDFDRCNGIALTQDGKTAYMYVFLLSIPAISLTFPLPNYGRTDTGATLGSFGINQTEPATMQVHPYTFFFICVLKLMNRYAFDVDPDSQTFLNRRIFAYVDAGIPDGIQIDKNGNVYAGCGDGVQVGLSFPFPFDPTFINFSFIAHFSLAC
jgi:gluconolactonase